MEDIFITNIHIKKVRHLKNIDIMLSQKEKKHLIITGKNGSGKTSLLEEIGKCLSVYINKINYGYTQMENFGVNISYNTEFIDIVNKKSSLFLFITALRDLNITEPQAPTSTIELENTIKNDNNIQANTSIDFLQRMVNMNYDKFLAEEDNDLEEAKRIDSWFAEFTARLRKIYKCDTLELKSERKSRTFKIVLPDREPFGLNEMSDGYSAILRIVMELINLMEAKSGKYCDYTMPGIVLIDEIETHLHIELQKEIMPFLTDMFPNVQFIVSTHSPFVISSISNAVMYDLEKNLRVEDLSGYSYEGVIENYYEKDMYSNEAKKRFEEYKILYEKNTKKELTGDETSRFADIIFELSAIPPSASKELIHDFLKMEKERKLK